MNYSEYVKLSEYDKSIASHAYIDACNSSIIYWITKLLLCNNNDKTVTALDAGSGTGQVVRLLLGLPNVEVEACDIDSKAEKYLKQNPETSNVPYHNIDICNHKLPKKYDVIVLRGVLHHIPKQDRPRLLKNLFDQSKYLIVADEGIQEYQSEEERLKNCETWYSYVIKEASRRGLDELAKMEAKYLNHELLASADDGGDFKEGVAQVLEDGLESGLKPVGKQLIGNWMLNKGGFYTIVY